MTDGAQRSIEMTVNVNTDTATDTTCNIRINDRWSRLPITSSPQAIYVRCEYSEYTDT